MSGINALIEFLEGMKRRGVKYIPYAGVSKNSVNSSKENAAELADLRESKMGDCKLCTLYSGRKNIVFGEGNPNATLMFIGEGPGRDEDIQGRPFVGAAGQLLTKIIEAIKLKREDVYIANIVKCRPPGNRDPQPDEVIACRPFLEEQIEIIKPQIICLLGRHAAKALLGDHVSITRIRGKFVDWEGIKIMPTFHPSYLLRNPEAKRPVWEDMKLIRKEYDKIISQIKG